MQQGIKQKAKQSHSAAWTLSNEEREVLLTNLCQQILDEFFIGTFANVGTPDAGEQADNVYL